MNMNDIIPKNILSSEAFDYTTFIYHLLCVIVSSFFVQWHYRRYFPVFSKSQSMERTLVVIAIVTFLVITTVKSSLALSLGLVGALSIIRFRTPIKEPFELSYLFLAIAIGLGFGAGQVLTTVTVVFVLLGILIIIMRKSDVSDNDLHFIYITIDRAITSSSTKDLIKNLQENFDQSIILRRMDQTPESLQLTLCMKLEDTAQLTKISHDIEAIFSPSNLSIVDGQKVMPF